MDPTLSASAASASTSASTSASASAPSDAASASSTVVEVVSNRYFASGEYELVSADGVAFRVGPKHLEGSNLAAVAQSARVVSLADAFADEKAVHLLLDFQGATLAADTADTAGADGADGGGSGPDSGRDSGLGAEGVCPSRASLASPGEPGEPREPREGSSSSGSGSAGSEYEATLSRPASARGVADKRGALSPGAGGVGGGQSESPSPRPSPIPSRDLALAGLDRLLPALRLAHRYEFPVQGDIVLAVTRALGGAGARDTLATFVAAAELGSPDLAAAAVRAMRRRDARRFCPLAWGARTFAAVPRAYLWALQQCFVTTDDADSADAAGAWRIEPERFVPALFAYRSQTAAGAGAGSGCGPGCGCGGADAHN